MDLSSNNRERISRKSAAEYDALARMEGEGNMPMAQETHPMAPAVELCWECRTICMDTLFGYCLERGGEHAEAAHVKLMFDCIEITQVAADLMRRKLPQHGAGRRALSLNPQDSGFRRSRPSR
jgi:hypothetical protein